MGLGSVGKYLQNYDIEFELQTWSGAIEDIWDVKWQVYE